MAIVFTELIPSERAKQIVAEASREVIAALRQELSEPPTPKRTRAPNGTFDRKTYQRELMRNRRKAGKDKLPHPG